MKILSLLTLGMLLCAAVACGDSDETNSSTTADTASTTADVANASTNNPGNVGGTTNTTPVNTNVGADVVTPKDTAAPLLGECVALGACCSKLDTVTAGTCKALAEKGDDDKCRTLLLTFEQQKKCE